LTSRIHIYAATIAGIMFGLLFSFGCGGKAKTTNLPPEVANVTAQKCNEILVEYPENVDGTAGLMATYQMHPDLAITGVDFPHLGDSTLAFITISGEMENTSYTLEVVDDVKDTGWKSMDPLCASKSFRATPARRSRWFTPRHLNLYV
jgi:hypothetical protein